MATDDRLRELEEKYEGYKVYDNRGEKIGKVDDLFVDESDREEYIGVKMGLFGMRSTLIPMDVARVNERDRAIEVADTKDHVKDAPTFDDDDDITPEFERRIRSHFGLEDRESSATSGSYGRYSATGAEGTAMGDDTTRGEDLRTDREGDADDDYRELDRELDREGAPEAPREPVGREEYRNREDYGGSGATGTAATGGVSDLETGDRGSAIDQARREAYLEGLREGRREASGETGGEGRRERGESQAASEYLGEGQEGARRSDEGGSQESGVARVWRRISS